MSNFQLPDCFNALAISEFGTADCLKLIEKPLTLPQSGQVLIKAMSASINPIDVKTRAGLGWAAQQNADKLPMVAGYDCFGEVVAVGDDVTEHQCGDAVVGMIGFPLEAGCYAQYVLAKPEDVVAVTAAADVNIAALPLAGLTAYQGLFEHGLLSAGETVVISAAAGGVGHIAVQLAVSHGANVIAIASEKNHQMLLALGAAQVVDYRELSQFESLSNIDLWFDLVGGDAALAQLALVKEIKRLITVPTMSAAEVCLLVESSGCQAQGMLVKPDQDQLTKLVQLVENDKLRLNIVKQLDYKDASEGHVMIEQAKVSGKIVLTIS